MRESTDRGVLEIFGSLPAEKIISAQWNRLVVDLNRGPGRLDARGVVPHVDYYGRPIYRSDYLPDGMEIERRLGTCYWPFHKRLAHLVKEQDATALFDCHSLNGTGPEEAPDPGKTRKDIILGNNGDDSGNVYPARGSITCPTKTLQLIKEAFERAGFSVSLNDPYPGGFITAYHGRKFAGTGKSAVQIEINQDLYLNRTSKRLSPNRLNEVKERVSLAFEDIAWQL